MRKRASVEQMRATLDRFIDTHGLTDMQIVQIIESESMNRHSFLNSSTLLKRGVGC